MSCRRTPLRAIGGSLFNSHPLRVKGLGFGVEHVILMVYSCTNGVVAESTEDQLSQNSVAHG